LMPCYGQYATDFYRKREERGSIGAGLLTTALPCPAAGRVPMVFFAPVNKLGERVSGADGGVLPESVPAGRLATRWCADLCIRGWLRTCRGFLDSWG